MSLSPAQLVGGGAGPDPPVHGVGGLEGEGAVVRDGVPGALPGNQLGAHAPEDDGGGVAGRHTRDRYGLPLSSADEGIILAGAYGGC